MSSSWSRPSVRGVHPPGRTGAKLVALTNSITQRSLEAHSQRRRRRSSLSTAPPPSNAGDAHAGSRLALFGGLDNVEAASDDVFVCSVDADEPEVHHWERLSRPPLNADVDAAARPAWPERRWRHCAVAAVVEREMCLVIYGGVSGYDQLLDDTYAFNPTTRRWRKLEPPPNPFIEMDEATATSSGAEEFWGPPSPRSASAMAAGSGSCFLFGGYSRVPGKLISEDVNDLHVLDLDPSMAVRRETARTTH